MIEGLLYQLFSNNEAPVSDQYFSPGTRSVNLNLSVLQNEQPFFEFFNEGYFFVKKKESDCQLTRSSFGYTGILSYLFA